MFPPSLVRLMSNLVLKSTKRLAPGCSYIKLVRMNFDLVPQGLVAARLNGRVGPLVFLALLSAPCLERAQAEEPVELTSLRRTYEAEQAKLTDKYVKALKRAEVEAVQANDLEAAIALRDERLAVPEGKASLPLPNQKPAESVTTKRDSKPAKKIVDIPPGSIPKMIDYDATKPQKNFTIWATRNREKDGTLLLSLETPSGVVHELGEISGDAFPVSEDRPRRVIFPVSSEIQTEKGSYELRIENKGLATISIWKVGSNE